VCVVELALAAAPHTTMLTPSLRLVGGRVTANLSMAALAARLQTSAIVRQRPRRYAQTVVLTDGSTMRLTMIRPGTQPYFLVRDQRNSPPYAPVDQVELLEKEIIAFKRQYADLYEDAAAGTATSKPEKLTIRQVEGGRSMADIMAKIDSTMVRTVSKPGGNAAGAAPPVSASTSAGSSSKKK
jgi:hypothetical protein